MALIPCTECGRRISDRAQSCPQCGAPTRQVDIQVVGGYGGYEWRSKAQLFGLPLVHVAGGWDPKTGARRVARGIVAVGDIAIGGLAVGGLALGGVAIGGCSVGLAALGGAAIGVLLGVGGFATGFVAFGGLAIGYYALGGLSIGPHSLIELFEDPANHEVLKRWLGPGFNQLRP